MGQKPGHW